MKCDCDSGLIELKQTGRDDGDKLSGSDDYCNLNMWKSPFYKTYKLAFNTAAA